MMTCYVNCHWESRVLVGYVVQFCPYVHVMRLRPISRQAQLSTNAVLSSYKARCRELLGV